MSGRDIPPDFQSSASFDSLALLASTAFFSYNVRPFLSFYHKIAHRDIRARLTRAVESKGIVGGWTSTEGIT